MANYYGVIRSNYFHVKNEEAFKEFMSHVQGCEDNVELFEDRDENGNIIFGFGCYGDILGYVQDEDDDFNVAYDNFTDGLQKHVADDDAILIFEAGHEKLRYVIGCVQIITSKDVEFKNIQTIGMEIASKMLNNSNYDTKTDY